MKRLFLILFFLFVPVIVFGAELHFAWDYNFVRDPDVHKFVLYKNGEKASEITDFTRQEVNATKTVCRWTYRCKDCVQGKTSFYMTAVDDAGQESPPSESVVYDKAPYAPSNVRITITIEVSTP